MQSTEIPVVIWHNILQFEMDGTDKLVAHSILVIYLESDTSTNDRNLGGNEELLIPRALTAFLYHKGFGFETRCFIVKSDVGI